MVDRIAWFFGNQESTIERFWNKVLFTSDCWEWQGSVKKSGYGRFHLTHSLAVRAHRFAYQLMVGEIPKGLVLDHLCRNRSCVNPNHLEIVTIGENVLRGDTFSAKNKKKTHCSNGHPLTENNLYKQNNNWRICIICLRNRARGRGRIKIALRDWF
jgi:hypothetical protein